MKALAIATILILVGQEALSAQLALDNQEIINHMSGTLEGKAEPNLPYYFDENENPVQAEDKKLFTDVYIKVDFDSKVVTTKAIYNQKDGVRIPITFQGKFNDEGIAYARYTEGSIRAIAGLRCVDQCKSVVLDIGIKSQTQSYEEQQFILTDPSLSPALTPE